MVANNSHVAGPSVETARRSRVAVGFPGAEARSAVLVVLLCAASACSNANAYPGYADAIGRSAPTSVGTGDIYTLSTGNLIW